MYIICSSQNDFYSHYGCNVAASNFSFYSLTGYRLTSETNIYWPSFIPHEKMCWIGGQTVPCYVVDNKRYSPNVRT